MIHANIVRTGVIKNGQALRVTRGSRETIDYTDSNKYGIIIAPEGAHEAWTISRDATGFSIDIWNRSGTNRVGYNGDVSWMVFEVCSAPTQSGIVLSGVSDSSNFDVLSPPGFNFTDLRYRVLVCPEGGHEAWQIGRSSSRINISVWNRSGTNRVGYSGKVSWAIIDTQVRNPTYPKFIDIPTTVGDTVTGSGTNYNSTGSIVALMSPDNGHEAWSINRSTINKIVGYVWNRSGTNRVGYNGNLAMPLLAVQPDMDARLYPKGFHTLSLLPYQTIDIYAFGSGGAGGGSVYTGGDTNTKGYDGTSTIIYLGNREAIAAVAGGGMGATGGWWGNGSHMTEGSGGAGGTPVISSSSTFQNFELELVGYASVSGKDGIVNRWSPQNVTDSTILKDVAANNSGGRGAWGIGDESRAGGGSGGAGAGVYLRILNKSNQSKTIQLSIERGGLPVTNKGGNFGSPGGDGSVIVVKSDVELTTRYKFLTADLRIGADSKAYVSQRFSYTAPMSKSTSYIYNPGTYDVTLPNEGVLTITCCGGGGGGGLGVHQDTHNDPSAQSYINGKDGGDTSVTILSSPYPNEVGFVIVEADGGKGGGHGWWDNGSAWVAGQGGAGGFGGSFGVNTIGSGASTGETGHQDRNDRAGGKCYIPQLNNGNGGAGGNGYGNHNPADGWAAGGGGGGYASCTFTNRSGGTQTIRFVVGAGGAAGAYGNYNKDPKPTAGQDGIAYVTVTVPNP